MYTFVMMLSKKKMNVDNVEKQYVAGLVKGSYKDFTSLYEIYSPRLYAFVFDLVRSRTITKDIVQETFIKIWVIREQVDVTLSFKSFLFTIARNLVLNEFRRQMNNPVFADYIACTNGEDLAENTIEQQMDFDEFNRRLQEAKLKLTSRQREIFEMNKEQGLSPVEIAHKISITEQSVRNQLSASLQILKREMADYQLLFVLFFGFI